MIALLALPVAIALLWGARRAAIAAARLAARIWPDGLVAYDIEHDPSTAVVHGAAILVGGGLAVLVAWGVAYALLGAIL